MLIRVPVEVANFQPKADRSWKLTFATQRELTGEEVKELADNYLGLGYLLFSPNGEEIQAENVPEETVESTSKSPSQRLRNVLYVMWQQRGKPGGAFDPWYQTQMERFIETVKNKLEPEES